MALILFSAAWTTPKPQPLGQVSLEELDREENRPLISALVIGKDENMPSSGFWTFCIELGIAVADRKLF